MKIKTRTKTQIALVRLNCIKILISVQNVQFPCIPIKILYPDKRSQHVNATLLGATWCLRLAAAAICCVDILTYCVDILRSSLLLPVHNWETGSSFSFQTTCLFFVFMWRHHFPKPKNLNLCEVLVLSDVITSKNLTFCNVWARQGSSLSNRARLNFQVCELRYIEMADW